MAERVLTPEQRERARQTSRDWGRAHPDIVRQRSVAWAKDHPDEALAHGRKYRHKMQQTDADWRRRKVQRELDRRKRIQREAIEHYGGKCFCCGETIPLFLALDHIHGGGSKHRRELKTLSVAQWARRNDWPPILQVACHNCNKGRDMNGGICPHSNEIAS